MRKNHTFETILTVLFLFISVTLSAQMNDQQVVQEAMRLERTGMSPQQIVLELNRRGVSISQLERIRNQHSSQQGITTVAPTFNNDPISVLRSMPEVPTIVRREPQPDDPNQIYGQNFFSAENLTFAPNMNMPTPANYILGTGDEIIIDVWGNSELNEYHTISPDGHITIPGLGRIHLSGLSVRQAELRIRREFSLIFSDLTSPNPQTFIAMSVGNVRTINVNVMGEVITPGTYTLTSFASAFHALYASGGPNNIGSLRNIHVFRNGERVATVDLYEYLMNGNNMGDITLRDGDIVRVEPHSILAQITGNVRRPMRYEMLEKETLSDLIRFAGGFTGNAFQSNVSLQRRGRYEQEAFTLSEQEFASFNLKDGDRVQVGNILNRFTNRVEITGAVYRPGQYAIGDEIRTVRDLVNIAQGITGDAYLYRVLLYREQDDLRQTMVSFDLADLLNGRIPDIPLQRNDRLHIPSIFSIEDNITVSISGEVRAGGSFPFTLNMHLEDLILRAGGLRESASTAQIDVFRRMRDPGSRSLSASTGETFSFSLRDGEILLDDTTFVLQPFDHVVIRRSPGYEEQQLVTVRGEVLFGGQYARIRRDERLSSFVERAGGLTEFAYAQGARLSRQLSEAERKRTRDAFMVRAVAEGDSLLAENMDFGTQFVGINLEKALQNPGSDADIILREGDELYIPVYNGTVKISGGVLFPNTVAYTSGMSLDRYVKQAGGYSRLAMRNRAFVVHMNGTVSTGRWAKIEPGSEIVIPERPERQPLSFAQAVSLSTSVATLALVILRFL
ncbi:MAG: SLBB domain-containing protein [Dysgonamonadaceae bacterium]|jgi:protein involved in polysaccharide export with SLBB domain|nr:SLBB domain-containing protein [Dysgonamonadaceae bacterium]